MSPLDRITTTANDLFFQYGIRSVSMDDIARKLGMSKKTLYQHVDNKADLVKKSISAYNNVTIAHFQEIVKDPNKNAIDELVEIAEINSEILKKLNPSTIYDLKKYHNQCWNEFEEYHNVFITNIISQNIEKGIKQNLYRKDINVAIITKFYVSQIDLITDTQIFPPNEFSMANVYIEFLKYHIFGMATEKGAKHLNNKIINAKNKANA